jgi:hypothetical protein
MMSDREVAEYYAKNPQHGTPDPEFDRYVRREQREMRERGGRERAKQQRQGKWAAIHSKQKQNNRMTDAEYYAKNPQYGTPDPEFDRMMRMMKKKSRFYPSQATEFNSKKMIDKKKKAAAEKEKGRIKRHKELEKTNPATGNSYRYDMYGMT